MLGDPTIEIDERRIVDRPIFNRMSKACWQPADLWYTKRLQPGRYPAGPEHQAAGVVELVDTPDLGSGGFGRGGSSPFARTTAARPPTANPIGVRTDGGDGQ